MSTHQTLKQTRSHGAFAYRPTDPQSTVLHKVVRESLEGFLAFCRDNYARPVPRYVEREFRKFID
jgi:hypothetical protein